MYKVRTINEYFIKEMLKQGKKINCDGFYKDDLIKIIEICQEEYSKLLKEVQNEKD